MKPILLTLVFLFLAACSHKKLRIYDDTRSSDPRSGLELWASWVKDKGKKYDVLVHMANESHRPRRIYVNDIHCYKGDRRGRLSHKYARHGEQSLHFRPRETKEVVMICRFDKKFDGEFRVRVEDVYRVPKGVQPAKSFGNSLSYVIEG